MSLEELVARTEPKSLHQIHTDFGTSYLQVLQLAKRASAGLMVIVAHNHKTLGRLLMDSKTGSLVYKA